MSCKSNISLTVHGGGYYTDESDHVRPADYKFITHNHIPLRWSFATSSQ
jgi:hypothetical protein